MAGHATVAFFVCLSMSWISVVNSFDLIVVHTNDVHARYEQTNTYSGPCSPSDAQEGKCFGGYPRLVTKVRELREVDPEHTIVLDAGDQYQGTIWFYHYGWQVASHFMNWLGYDVMALGNHEFDDGVKGLVPFLSNVSFPVLSCNIDASKEPSMQGKFKKSHVLTVAGQKIGIVGYTTKDTPDISNVDDLIFNDEILSIRSEVEALKNQGINKIIALGHAGLTKDKKIAAEVDGVDIVVGGHTHSFTYTGTPPSTEDPVDVYPYVATQSSGNTALVVQAYAYSKYLGHLTVTFDDEGRVTEWNGNPILLDSSVEQDNATLTNMIPWREGVKNATQQTVGITNVFLQGHERFCRRLECNLGNVITDGMVYWHQKNRKPSNVSWADVSIALINGGGIRTSVEQGDITLEMVLQVHPFRNNIDLIHLRGRHLRLALEHSVASYSTDANADLFGGFLQMSGLMVSYDISKPPNNRVVKVMVRCSRCTVPRYEELQEEQVYVIAIPNFTANGGDGYTVIRDNKLEHILTGDLDSDILTEYLKSHQPILAGLEGRIRFVDSDACTTSSAWRHQGPSLALFFLTLLFIQF